MLQLVDTNKVDVGDVDDVYYVDEDEDDVCMQIKMQMMDINEVDVDDVDDVDDGYQ